MSDRTKLWSLALTALLSACPDSGKSRLPDGVDCDEEDHVWLYPDEDGDRYGDPTGKRALCKGTPGWTEDNTDCDDDDALVHPGAAERCNEVDDDCDELIDEYLEQYTFYSDQDADGYGNPDTTLTACGADWHWSTEGTDCNDDLASVNPGETEECNERDDDCDGEVDEGLETFTLYLDEDFDGYGDSDITREGCADLFPWSPVGGDCLDSDESTHPEATEDCEDGWDRDCDGLVDCEDEDCEDESVCGETSCADGLDEDDDGYTDCQDDECWGVSDCPTILVARVIDGTGAEIHRGERDTFWISSCDGTAISTSGSSSTQGHFAWGMQGVINRYAPDTDVIAQCAWGMELAAIGWSRVSRRSESGDRDTSSTSFSQRTGFWISGDCGVSTSSFLPPLTSLQYRWNRWYDGYWRGSSDWHSDDHGGYGSTSPCDRWNWDSWDFWSSAGRMMPGERRAWTTSAGEVIR